MSNELLLQRLKGIQSILVGAHEAGGSLSTASRGEERRAFVNNFLECVMPPIYRCGTGEATDASGNVSGQLDVVIEYPFSPSLPTSPDTPRLYLAESVAAVIEVKSNAAKQWDQAVATANKLAAVQRKFGGKIIMGGFGEPKPQIPLFVAGYKGWIDPTVLKRKLSENTNIAGVLIIEGGLFVSSKQYGNITSNGAQALWALVSVLHHITTGLLAASTTPLAYTSP